MPTRQHGVAGPADRELQRLGRRCAVALRISVAACAGVLAILTTPDGFTLPTVGAVVVLNAWSVGYLVLMSRDAGNWLLAADTVVVCALCLTQRWTGPPEVLQGGMSWVVAVASIAVATWQWHSGTRIGGGATAAVILVYLAGTVMTPASLTIALWLAAEAALSRGLYLLVHKGAQEADRIMADAERARRVAAVAAARRADEREHLAAMHDTAATTMLTIGMGLVEGREPWLATQLADALDEVTRGTTTTSGQTDLVLLIGDVIDRSPVTADLSATGAVPLPAVAAEAICRSVREALRNIARHAGVGTASVLVEHRAGRVLVEIADHGTGFDPELVSPHRRGISLSIVERMAAAGGRAGVLSSSGLGTRVRLEWPDG